MSKKIFDRVNLPEDLKDLSLQEMEQLAAELRTVIVDTVSTTGGHLAANLGVVELTIALLKVFSPPGDKIVWDVGHQTYSYKLLTGRKDRISTLRQANGLSGFAKRSESKYDSFGAGHAGTALSAGLGMAYARDHRGGSESVVVITGDASAGCGISLEALNNLSEVTSRIIVIMNDNEMSIARNVGAISVYLGHLLANPRYNRWKRSVEAAAKKVYLGWLRSAYYRFEESLKNLFLHSVIFEEFGLRYVGPIDGHNINSLIDALSIAKEYERPIILHVATTKGKGYAFAESQPEKWHGTSGFNVESGESPAVKGPKGYSEVFGSALSQMAAGNSNIVAITAAMARGTGLAEFAERFPKQFFDVGMSEEHAVVFAAGLACEGLSPVVAIYSTFMQRSVDCIVHDVCLQSLPVVMCLDRAGVVGDDGPTHHGVFDIALLRPIPGLIIMQPRDEVQLANMLYTAIKIKKPVVIRYPRGSGPGLDVSNEFVEMPVGKAEVISGDAEDVDVVLWVLGDMVSVGKGVSEILNDDGIKSAVIDARFIKPLDEELLKRSSCKAKVVVTIENGLIAGGFGSAVESFLSADGFRGRVLKCGWPDEFVPQGKVEYLMEKYGLTVDAVSERVKNNL